MQCFRSMKESLTLGEAASAIGVSQDTLRRWDRAGKLHTHRDARNRRMVSAEEVRRLSGRRQRHPTGERRRRRCTLGNRRCEPPTWNRSPSSSGSYTPAQTTTSSGNNSADGFSQVPGSTPK